MDRDERGRIYDGDTVRAPVEPAVEPSSPPVTRGRLVTGWAIFGAFAAAAPIKVIRTVWHWRH